MKFTKMQGCGNDYVYVDAFRETVSDPAALAREISDRHYGVGGDGLILIEPSSRADAFMRMFNLDGSEGSMCGNGIRCCAKYIYDHGIIPAGRRSAVIDTKAGLHPVSLTVEDGKAVSVQSTMEGAMTFLDKAAHARMRQKGLNSHECEWFDEQNSCWFPPVED